MRTLTINPRDNVAVVLSEDGPVAFGHKVAICHIPCGSPVVKYGFPIGHATADIPAGTWVHTHNLATNLETPALAPTDVPSARCNTQATHTTNSTFRAFPRANGDYGIRNELWIVPTVGCVNAQCRAIAETLKSHHGDHTIQVLEHPYGCSQLGDDHECTVSAISALLRHPNGGGVLLVGLGCENNQIERYRPLVEGNPRARTLVAQKVPDELDAGVALGGELLALMASDRRVAVPVSRLRIGLKCGGSDGLSGITANPLVGSITDRLCAAGGAALLTEVPEMFGAEQLLMARAASPQVRQNIDALIADFKTYFRSHGQPVGENPSPGNKAGGITTLEEKSLGCVQKGGTATITDVLRYAQPLTIPGLSLLQAPGNDMVAATALALSGCHMVLFTTGRGTPLGTIVPTLKIASNTPLALRKPAWIDFDAGALLSQHRPTALTQLADSLWQLIISTANGTPTANERSSSRSFAIFKNGITL